MALNSKRVINCRGGRLWLAFVALGIVTAPALAVTHDPYTVHIFHDNDIHFAVGDSSRFDTDFVRGLDNGRQIERTVELTRPDYAVRVMAHLSIRPMPKDEQSMYDKWDRAGNVRLVRPGRPDIEVIKFITAYGGTSDHAINVTHLAPLLKGSCTFAGFIDTWVSPAWKIDFSLVFEPIHDDEAPAWVESILYEESITAARMLDGPLTVSVDIPIGMAPVVMNYLVSGHCTDGSGADEFVSKANVLSIDGREVHRFKPWRDDCRHFRAENPYCRRWADGSWSSDYSRSGWCPGDQVSPVQLDLTEYLPPGRHQIAFMVEDVRPRNDAGNFGYWRVSCHLLGWGD